MNNLHPLKELMMKRVAAGLQRAAVTTCSRWAEQYRVMGAPFPGKWSWEHHWWLLEPHDAEGESLVCQKGAQMGFTEWALNRALFTMDVQGLSVLYLLPTAHDAGDFSSARFDKALENSEYLATFFSNVKNVGHKRAGNTSLYVRGSNSRSQLKSIDTALIVYDEIDEMDKKNVTLAEERQSGQKAGTQQNIKLSTPTIENEGINAEYKKSTQEHYFFQCPHCKRRTELIFPDCLIITGESVTDQKVNDSYYICKECKAKLDHETKSEWLRSSLRGGTGIYVPGQSDRDIRGFHVPQLYSTGTIITPAKIALSYLKGLRDPTDATEFWNSKLGLPYAAEGSKVSSAQIAAVMKGYTKGEKAIYGGRPITMGVDVGSVCHVWIDEWTVEETRLPGLAINDQATPRTIYEGHTSGKMDDFDELSMLMNVYGVNFSIIDSEPERRQALTWATRHWGRVLLCDFQWSQTGRTIQETPPEECTIKVNRTSWMDMALGRFRNKSILVPSDLSDEAKEHIKEPQRVFKRDKWNNPFGYYHSVNADHLALARVYSEIAFPFAYSQNLNIDLAQVL
jgi:hypothetical protein